MQVQRTFMPTEEEALAQRKWYVVDAAGQPLGRIAAEIARILRGKHKAIFVPHLDVGDFVIVVNADKVELTGEKWEKKLYHFHSRYPGGLRTYTARQLWQKRPERLLELAVRRMLPKNRLGRKLMKKLYVYAGPDHPHAAQKPEPWPLGKFWPTGRERASHDGGETK
ncbi:50S ribosomal protein L13 [Brockia lithotrophica]|uniref:Large ribosomal subunit protein uL13 n=1 Tax=Brockia lithotrophica TaxID=933949 RepID=A0A660KXM0_9BACL|nr:50S ribosomal protein L13 [Brockia lithotrophica]RKQ85540.1 LSU ribosomal protein L13P [Brockia lithotrophica]